MATLLLREASGRQRRQVIGGRPRQGFPRDERQDRGGDAGQVLGRRLVVAGMTTAANPCRGRRTRTPPYRQGFAGVRTTEPKRTKAHKVRRGSPGFVTITSNQSQDTKESAMTAESAAIVRTFPVGRYTVTATLRRKGRPGTAQREASDLERLGAIAPARIATFDRSLNPRSGGSLRLCVDAGNGTSVA